MVFALIHTCSKLIKVAARPKPAARTCLSFTLSDLLFGIDLCAVKEIVRCGILAVPRDKPGLLRGIYRHGGRHIPILDLNQHYHGQLTDIGGRTCVLVVELHQGKYCQELGILVDEIRSPVEFPPDALRPLSETVGRALQVEGVEGIVQLKRDYLVVLNVDHLITLDAAREIRAYISAME